jgi:hypothetical protein
MKKFTAIIYDAGFKDSSPALMALSKQTILDEIEII